MDLSIDFGRKMDGDDDQIPSSSQWVARATRTGALPGQVDMDCVKWQSSQTSCAALDALMLEARESAARRLPKAPSSIETDFSSTSTSFPSSDFSLTSSSISPSASGSSASRIRRPPRSRRLDTTAMDTTSLSSSRIPSASESTPEATHFLNLLREVSDQVDENARRKKKFQMRSMNHPAPAEVKRQTEKENRRHVNATASSSMLPVHDGGSGGTRAVDMKGKAPAIVYRRSLPDLDTAATDGDVSMAETSFRADESMDVDAQSSSSSTRHVAHLPTKSHMPPPPVPVPKPQPNVVPHPPRPAVHSYDTGSRISSNAPSHANPHPLTRVVPRDTPPPPPLKPRVQTPLTQPRLSQTTSRPPVLGMRRLAPYGSSSSTFSPSQTLPARRKGFKPPLAKPPSPVDAPQRVQDGNIKRESPLRQGAAVRTLPTPDTTPDKNKLKDGGERSSSPAPAEADSSYGEISFDMDALEETMRKYD